MVSTVQFATVEAASFSENVLADDDGTHLPRAAAPPAVARSSYDTVGAAVSLLSNPHGGTVAHTFTVECVLEALTLAREMRPGASLKKVLSSSARLLLGKNGQGIAKHIVDGKFPLPSAALLRSSRVRLDLMDILFQQRYFMSGRYRHYQLVDSSPQLGYNILAVIEDTFVIPEAHTVEIHRFLAENASDHYFSWICPLSSSGLGKAGLI